MDQNNLTREQKLEYSTAQLMTKVRQARTDFKAFIMNVWSTDPTLELADFHDEAIGIYPNTKYKYTYWEAPRGGAKSLITTAFVAWRLGRDPNERIKIICANDKEARKRLYEIKVQMETNIRLQLCFPHLKKPKNAAEWNKSRIIVERDIASKDPSVEAMGIMSGALGSRATLIVLDDIVDLRNSVLNPKLKDQVIQKLRGEIIPLLEPEGIVRSCGTPWTLCLYPQTDVYTKNGLKKVEELKPTDKIWVSEGKFQEPKGIVSRHHRGKLVNLYIEGVKEPLLVTPEHRIPTSRGDIYAKEITTDDWVCWPGKGEELDSDELVKLGPQPIRKKHNTAKKMSNPGGTKGITKEIFEEAIKKTGSAYQAAKALGYSAGHGSTLATSFGLQCSVLGDLQCKKLMLVSKKFWWAVGLWIAEGTVAREEAYWYLGKNETEKKYADRIKNVAKTRILCSARIKKHHGSYCVVISSAVLSRWLKENFGHGAANKKLPYWIDRLPFKLLCALIQGIIDGDGYIQKGRQTVTTVSKDLAYGLQRVCAAHGISTYIWNRTRKNVYIEGRKIKNIKPEYNINFNLHAGEALNLKPRQKLKKDDIHSNSKPRAKFVKPRLWKKIKRIETTPYNGVVYDLQTSTGYFATNTIIVHNSDSNAIMKESSGWKTIGPHHCGTVIETDSKDISDRFVDKFTPIWPYKFDRQALIDLHEILGPAEYARAYLCQALTGDTVPIQGQWIKYYNAHVLGDPFQMQCLNIYDLAIEQTDKNDYFACVTILFDEKRKYVFVVDAWHERITFRNQAKAVIKEARNWTPQDIVIENGGYQGALASYLREDTKIPLPVYPFHNRGRSKERRTIEAQPFFEKGLVWFHPKFHPTRNPDYAMKVPLIGEVTSFPFDKHDDLHDALIMGLLTILECNPDMFGSEDEDEMPFELGESMSMRVTVV